LCNDQLYQEFMDLNEPEVAAERRKKEAEAAESARKESLTIHQHLPKVSTADQLITGVGWRDATLTAKEREEAEKIAEEERSGMRQIPDPL
jgi:Zn-finger domain-containing protein